MVNYEDYYDSAMKEVRRLRAVVNRYSRLNNRIFNDLREAKEKNDWDIINALLELYDEE